MPSLKPPLACSRQSENKEAFTNVIKSMTPCSGVPLLGGALLVVWEIHFIFQNPTNHEQLA